MNTDQGKIHYFVCLFFHFSDAKSPEVGERPYVVAFSHWCKLLLNAFNRSEERRVGKECRP